MTYSYRGHGRYSAPNPATPARQAQIDFVLSLLRDKQINQGEHDSIVDEITQGLTKMRASVLINQLKELNNKALSAEEIVALPAGDWLAKERQLDYFRALLDERDVSDTERELLGGLLDSRRVSRAIDLLQNRDKVGGEETVEDFGYIGTVKERLRGLDGQIKLIRDFEGDYGWTKLMVVKLNTGHLVKFSGSGQTLYQYWEEGDRVHIEAATVKDHKPYRGQSQTVLTRVVLGQRQVVDDEPEDELGLSYDGPGGRELHEQQAAAFDEPPADWGPPVDAPRYRDPDAIANRISDRNHWSLPADEVSRETKSAPTSAGQMLDDLLNDF